MRRTMITAAAVAAMLAGGAVPAGAGTVSSASAATTRGGWTPEQIPPFDAAAGVLCDFPVHYDVLVNRVRTKVVETYPDGTPKRQLAVGALFLDVSNADTGAGTVVDASGSAAIDYGTDGSMLWHVVGPVIARLAAGTSNLPRGLYTINGTYRIAFSPAGFKTITLKHGTIHDLCPDLDQPDAH
ncbi:hypothetical protein [Actinomadura sp. DC4]|uniref:hypothetical protein n=1 Tax=Actinomadura sp. DC4 TaxID=3055069 RepID=UPI0025B0843F|nr:hypothetical protein [Actinomadura sp. DC4]MDN3353620.1 hypothetical protein [Actinomadura sp. DC4]